LTGELGVGVDAGGHHHGRLVAVADEAGELDPRQHVAHVRVGEQLGLDRGHVVEAVLQRGVFVALELRGLPTIRWPVVRAEICARPW
jgi:hypothetical protein